MIGLWRSLVVLNGFIAMVIYSSMSDNLGFDIWVLLEFGVKESWTKLITIDPSLDLKRPLLFWKSGQIFMENTKGQLVLYDPFTQATKNVQLDGHKGSVRVVQSILPLSIMNAMCLNFLKSRENVAQIAKAYLYDFLDI